MESLLVELAKEAFSPTTWRSLYTRYKDCPDQLRRMKTFVILVDLCRRRAEEKVQQGAVEGAMKGTMVECIT
jgi:hypothetical protein